MHVLRPGPRAGFPRRVVRAETIEDALSVPETALRYRGEQIFVETVNGPSSQSAEPADVEIGIVDDTRVQILSGLEEGVEVLLQ